MIISGGLATRLGPLTATMSKSLVTVGQRPMIVRQIVDSGAKRVVVVTSPSSRDQVVDLLGRCLSSDVECGVITQLSPNGPVDAIRIGMQAVGDGPVRVLFADTLMTNWDIGGAGVPEVSVGHQFTDARRSWTYFHQKEWHDDVIDFDVPDVGVFTGYMYHQDARELKFECGMAHKVSTLLNEVDPVRRWTNEWYDTGDVMALAETRRRLFVKREHHSIQLSSVGTVLKAGDDLTAQSKFLKTLPQPALTLFPHIYHASDRWHETEYVDLPSLAELWLYWPGRPDMWEHIVRTVLDRVTDLWHASEPPKLDDLRGYSRRRARQMYGFKLRERLLESGVLDGVTEYPHVVEKRVKEELTPVLVDVITSSTKHVLIHGDLNFCNVLYGLGTDQVKLLDPRGEWGDGSGLGDQRYELAKLRYSWYGFAAVAHDLDPWTVRERRADCVNALDRLLEDAGYDLRELAAIEATLFLSALPLHPERQRKNLLRLGLEKIEVATL